MAAAIIKVNGQGFRHLLIIDPGATTPLYLDCEGRKVGAIQYTGDLITVHPTDESMHSASDLTIELRDTAANRAAIDLAVDVKLYLWAVGTDSADTDLKLWGEISDPIVYAGGVIRFDVISRQAKQWNQSLGRPIIFDDYPGADPDVIGQTAPILYGSHIDHECIAIDAGAITTLGASISATSTVLIITDAFGLNASGVVQIDDEHIEYKVRSAGLANGDVLAQLTRGANNTTAVSHDKGAVVAQVKTHYDYLIASHPIARVSRVMVDDVIQSGNDFTILTNDNGVSKIRFKTRPLIRKSADIEVDEDITITASQPAHQHVLGTPVTSTTRQTGTRFNNEITLNGMTSRPGANNKVTFPALPNGTVGGFTEISLTASSAIQWEIGYWSGGGIFSTRFWNVAASGSGTRTVRLEVVRDDIWIRKVTSTSSVLLNTTNYRTVTVETTPSMTRITPVISTTRQGGINLIGNSVAETVIGKVVTCDCSGYADDISGSITGSANSIIQKPMHIIRHLLRTYGLSTNAETLTADFNTSDDDFIYSLAVRVDEPATVRDIIKSIEEQGKVIATYTGGRWRVTNRPSSTANLTPDFTITDSHVKRNEDGSTSMRESRTGLKSLINKYVYRARLKSNGVWVFGGIKEDLASQIAYGVRQKNIDLPYTLGGVYNLGRLLDWRIARESNPNRKLITMDVTAALYALEVGDVVRYNSTKHGTDLYFECVAISAKGLTESTITIEQI